jgi:hypothetical protein
VPQVEYVPALIDENVSPPATASGDEDSVNTPFATPS